jgi:hypothetical protein
MLHHSNKRRGYNISFMTSSIRAGLKYDGGETEAVADLKKKDDFGGFDIRYFVPDLFIFSTVLATTELRIYWTSLDWGLFSAMRIGKCHVGFSNFPIDKTYSYIYTLSPPLSHLIGLNTNIADRNQIPANSHLSVKKRCFPGSSIH